MTWFVWIQSARGPAPVKVFDSPDPGAPALEERLHRHVLAKHKLRPTEELATFDELERRYPPPREALS